MNISRFFLYASFSCLIACSGGGGGDGGAGNSNDDDDDDDDGLPTDTATPLAYTGLQTRAALSATNAVNFINGALTNSKAGDMAASQSTMSAAAAAARNNTPFKAALGQSIWGQVFYFHLKAFSGKPPASSSGEFRVAAAAADESEDCDSGRIDYYLDINALGEGTIVIDYVNCSVDDVVTDGMVTQVNHDIDSSDFSILHATLSFNRVTTRVNGFNFIDSGSIEIERFPETITEVVTMNIVRGETNSGFMARLQDMILHTQYRNVIGSDTYSETVTGRYYDSDHGYVDITTPQTVAYFNDTPGTGQLLLTGSEGSTLLLEFHGGFSFTASLDVNGDDAYESIATLGLGTFVTDGADIGDTDGDGIHNSWESDNGLDPDNPGDSDLDLDGDSFSNMIEYHFGSDADDEESLPSISDLSMELSSPADQVLTAGGASFLEFTIDNGATHLIDYVSVSISMPGEAEMREVTTLHAGGCQTGEGNSINCAIFTMGSHIVVHVPFFAPEAAGSYAYEAAIVASSSFDPDESNNLVSGQIEVIPATAELVAGFTTETDPIPTVEDFLYEYEIENNGPMNAWNVQASVELPGGVTIVTMPDYCDLEGQTVTCDLGNLLANETRTEQFRVMPPSTPGPITAHLTVISTTAELDTSDNTAEHTREITQPVSDLRVSFPSSTTMPIVATNTIWQVQIQPRTAGPDILPEVTVTIDLPAGIFILSSSVLNGAGTCVHSDPIVCTLTEAASNYRDIQLELLTSVPGEYAFPISISGDCDDPVSSNNSIVSSAWVGEPLTAIQAQIDAAADGDTVEVPASHYLGNLQYSKIINLVAPAGPENTLWVPDNIGLAISDTPGGEVTGFTFLYGKTAIRLDNSNLNVHGNIFDGLDEPSIYTSGTASAIIERNIMRNTMCESSALGVITIQNQSAPLIRNNVFLNNDCTVIRFTNWGSPGVIVNNQFIGNDRGAHVSNIDVSAGAYIGNNIFYDNGTAITAFCSTNCPFQSNLFYANDFDFANVLDPDVMNVNISADPLFTDAANGDYTLQSGSPAIDAGDVLNAPADDFNGDPRPVDGDGSTTAEPDIGAYEFQ